MLVCTFTEFVKVAFISGTIGLCLGLIAGGLIEHASRRKK